MFVELPPGDSLQLLVDARGNLNGHAPMIWQDDLRETLLDVKFKESVYHAGVFQLETRHSHLRARGQFAVHRYMRRSDVAEETIVEKA